MIVNKLTTILNSNNVIVRKEKYKTHPMIVQLKNSPYQN